MSTRYFWALVCTLVGPATDWRANRHAHRRPETCRCNLKSAGHANWRAAIADEWLARSSVANRQAAQAKYLWYIALTRARSGGDGDVA
jgi:hypothetical protein